MSGDVKNQSGIRYVDVVAGTGDLAARGKCVYAHYVGWLANGTRFDASREPQPNGAPGEPAAFVLGTGAVMQGWEVGFTGMRVGGTRRLYIPYQLAYGERGRPPLIPGRAALVFDVELLAVMESTRSGSPSASASCPALRG